MAFVLDLTGAVYGLIAVGMPLPFRVETHA